MNIANELQEAALILEDRASAAQRDLEEDGYWKPYAKETAWRDGFVNGFGGISSELVSVMTPGTCLLLADLFHHTVKFVNTIQRLYGEGDLPENHLDGSIRRILSVARAVNANAA